MTEENRLRGKKARAAGTRFEAKVRKDLEDKGWIVIKNSKNVEFGEVIENPETKGKVYLYNKIISMDRGKLVNVKNKFRGLGIPMMLGAGFPDFIIFQRSYQNECDVARHFQIRFVEAKSNGYLTPEEREKCNWIINTLKIPIIIAKKGEKRGEIIYVEFKQLNFGGINMTDEQTADSEEEKKPEKEEATEEKPAETPAE